MTEKNLNLKVCTGSGCVSILAITFLRLITFLDASTKRESKSIKVKRLPSSNLKKRLA
jgi:hypothetical protein